MAAVFFAIYSTSLDSAVGDAFFGIYPGLLIIARHTTENSCYSFFYYIVASPESKKHVNLIENQRGIMLRKILVVILTLVVILGVVFTGFLYQQAMSSRSMVVASGHDNGRLLPCPESPNCVSSQVSSDDSHYIDPIADPDGAKWAVLSARIEAMEGTEMLGLDGNYAYFAFRTPIMGFVDDVEFYFTPDSAVIHVRSASRVGYSDGNTNRNRIEAIRSAL